MSLADTLVWAKPHRAIHAECPVCLAKAGHALVLTVQDGCNVAQRLLRCKACGSRFYESRIPPDYAADDHPALRAQFYLEQNAGIQHMTRPLFALDRPEMDSMLDVGCGFGFAVMLAHHVLGWRACGLEPGQYGATAKALTGIDIRPDYLEADTDLGAPYGLVIASEVIEHIAEPYGFLALLRGQLQPGGVVALTTPNADVIRTGVADGELLQIVSPGGHMVLFTRSSLEFCLKRAGFAFVNVAEHGSGLTAYASDQPIALRGEAEAETEANRGYLALLQHLVSHSAVATPLWNGAAARLLGSAPASIAMPLFARMAEAWRHRYGIDITEPAALPDPGPPDLLEHARRYPLCLAGVLHNRARYERTLPGRDLLREVAWSRQAAVFAVAARASVRSAMLEDLDLRRISWEARLNLAGALALLAPELAGDLAVATARRVPGQKADVLDIPAGDIVRYFAPSFVRLVHGGDYAAAGRFAELFCDLDMVCAALGQDFGGLCHALYCLGILRMNALSDTPGAHHCFRRLAAVASDEQAQSSNGATAAHFAGLAQAHMAMTSGNDHVESDLPNDRQPGRLVRGRA